MNWDRLKPLIAVTLIGSGHWGVLLILIVLDVFEVSV